ncbi:MAG: hypothetical protein IJR99_15205 [Kiritimatiellae bacterium]|nr:hypothetical protein [Kiritimatiellia bacterium]
MNTTQRDFIRREAISGATGAPVDFGQHFDAAYARKIDAFGFIRRNDHA